MRGEEEEEDDLSFYICRDPFHFLIEDEGDEDIHMCVYKERERERDPFISVHFPVRREGRREESLQKDRFLSFHFFHKGG